MSIDKRGLASAVRFFSTNVYNAEPSIDPHDRIDFKDLAYGYILGRLCTLPVEGTGEDDDPVQLTGDSIEILNCMALDDVEGALFIIEGLSDNEGCSCGEAYGNRPAGHPKCKYCRPS